MAFEKDPNEIGVLWKKSGQHGDYMTGSIDLGGGPIKVVVFAIKSTNEKAPNWRVLRSVPRESAPVNDSPVIAPDVEDITF